MLFFAVMHYQSKSRKRSISVRYKNCGRLMHSFGCLTAILMLTLPSSLLAQQRDSVNLKYYFDDKGIATGLKVKTDFISIIHGDAPLILEKKYKKNVSLEGGLGLI